MRNFIVWSYSLIYSRKCKVYTFRDIQHHQAQDLHMLLQELITYF